MLLLFNAGAASAMAPPGPYAAVARSGHHVRDVRLARGGVAGTAAHHVSDVRVMRVGVAGGAGRRGAR
jgi:hypothetical protein